MSLVSILPFLRPPLPPMRFRLALTCLLLAAAAPAQVQPAPAEIRIAGSPQMSTLLTTWEAAFQATHPEAHFHNDLRSTLTAVSDVSSGHADLGALGRELWPEEREAFHTARGHDPLALAAAAGAYDVPKATFALMVFVHRSNPLTTISLDQLRAAFFTAPTIKSPATWGNLGLYGPHAAHSVHLYGFETINDKARVFRDKVAQPGDQWSATLHTFGNAPHHDAGQRILAALAHDPEGLAISNIHYATPAVRALPLVVDDQAIAPTRDNVAAQLYPLSREVYLVADPAALSPQARAFLAFIASPAGQAAVVKASDYLPLPALRIQEQASALAAAHESK